MKKILKVILFLTALVIGGASLLFAIISEAPLISFVCLLAFIFSISIVFDGIDNLSK